MHTLVATESPPSPNISRSLDRRLETGLIVTLLVTGLAIRLAVVHLPGYKVDIDYFTDWVNHLGRVPLDEFYGFASPYCDYLPGYIYVLALTGWLKGLVSGPATFSAADLELWIKVGPVIADLILALVAYRLTRRFSTPRRGLLAAALVLLSPGIVFVSAIWGQVESIASTFYLLSLTALLSGNPISAAVWAGAGLVTKPHYAAFLAPVGVAYLAARIRRYRAIAPSSRPGLSIWMADTIFLPGVVLVGTVQLLILPFSMSLWPLPNTEWVLHEIIMAAGIDSFTSSGAFNLWGTQFAGIRRPDDIVAWLSLTYQNWGFILLGVSLLPALVLAWTRPNHLVAVLLSATFVAMAFYELTTRMHERYFFMVVPLLALGAALRVWILPLYLGAAGLFVVNLWYIWANYTDVHANQRLTFLASDFSVLLFLAVAAALIWHLIGRGKTSNQPPDNPVLWERGPEEAHFNADGLFRALPRVARRRFSLSGGLIGAIVLCSVAAGLVVEKASDPVGGSIQVHRTETLAYRPWQDAGVAVLTGQRLEITADGLWMNRDVGMKHYGPTGFEPADSKYILPSAPKGALIGRVGDSEPFLIGESRTIIASTAGKLELVMNDWPTGFDNNRGRVYVTIVLSNPQ